MAHASLDGSENLLDFSKAWRIRFACIPAFLRCWEKLAPGPQACGWSSTRCDQPWAEIGSRTASLQLVNAVVRKLESIGRWV
jgi:hypothetical protein